jgi:hypothetical protein
LLLLLLLLLLLNWNFVKDWTRWLHVSVTSSCWFKESKQMRRGQWNCPCWEPSWPWTSFGFEERSWYICLFECWEWTDFCFVGDCSRVWFFCVWVWRKMVGWRWRSKVKWRMNEKSEWITWGNEPINSFDLNVFPHLWLCSILRFDFHVRFCGLNLITESQTWTMSLTFSCSC